MSSRGIEVALSDPASPRLLEPACLPLKLDGLCGLVLQQGVLVREGSSTVEAGSGAWLGPGRGVRVCLGPVQGGVGQDRRNTGRTTHPQPLILPGVVETILTSEKFIQNGQCGERRRGKQQLT